MEIVKLPTPFKTLYPYILISRIRPSKSQHQKFKMFPVNMSLCSCQMDLAFPLKTNPFLRTVTYLCWC